MIAKLLLTLLIACGCCLGGFMSGCGGNPNEADYLQSSKLNSRAEPESVASRKARTAGVRDPASEKTKGRVTKKP